MGLPEDYLFEHLQFDPGISYLEYNTEMCSMGLQLEDLRTGCSILVFCLIFVFFWDKSCYETQAILNFSSPSLSF